MGEYAQCGAGGARIHALRVCSLTDVDVPVTNAGVDPATLAICREAGRKVVLT